MTKDLRCSGLTALLALSAALCAMPSLAQDYPSKPIRIIDGFPPGGNTDFLSRTIAPALTQSWGQTAIVDNRPGAASNIAAETVAKSAPDGYTLLLGLLGALAPSMALYPKLPYDLVRDFSPVGTVASASLVLFVHPSIPARSLKELVALAKARPGALNYASCGIGCNTHLATEALKLHAGIDMVHVAYKGGAFATASVVGGESHLTFGSLATSLGLIKAGKIRALAMSGPQRTKALPNVPTIAESGYPGYDITAWYGVLAPAGTPPAIVAKLNAELARIFSSPAVMQRLATVELEPKTGSPDDFAAIIRKEMAFYANLVKKAGIKAE